MTERAQRKLKTKMRKAFKQAMQARKKHARLMARYTKMQKKYRKAA